MINKELNNYILNYIRNDKTHSAIMLTAPWGAGKSYYIQNSLKQFLEKEENGKHQCIVVSLYGLNSLFDVSEALYMESRLKFFANDSEQATTGKFAAKTILKGVTSFLGIDLSKTTEEMQELYESVNLSGKLVILEDLERTTIDILELLGYVNSLVEQDGVKVLLVSNEEKFIHYEIDGKLVDYNDDLQNDYMRKLMLQGINSPREKSAEKLLSQNSIQYLKAKEKTISDTIIYTGDKETEVKAILHDFPALNIFNTDECIKEICGILAYSKCANLRIFIFACQKSSDILTKISQEYSDNFKKCIFYSIILFSIKIKGEKIDTKNHEMIWDGDEYASTTLGSEKYPLFYFCFNYIKNHTFLENLVFDSSEKFKKMLLFDENTGFENKDTEILFSYHIQEESDVLLAINNIIADLEKKNIIPLYLYGKLARYFVQLKFNVDIDFNYEKARILLVQNLIGQNKNLKDELFYFGLEEKSDESYQEFLKLKGEMLDALKMDLDNYYGFDYKPDSIMELSNSIKTMGYITEKGTFAQLFENEKIIKMLFDCSAIQINTFRGIYISVYRNSNIADYLSGDYKSICDLKEKVESIESDDSFDKIKKCQLRWFVENLYEIANKLK